MRFADDVASALLGCGVRVLERPPILSGYTAAQAEGAVASGDGVGAAYGRGEVAKQDVDVVAVYEHTPADYVVVADAGRGWIRIVHRETKEILFSGPLKPEGFEPSNPQAMRSILSAMGVPLKQ